MKANTYYAAVSTPSFTCMFSPRFTLYSSSVMPPCCRVLGSPRFGMMVEAYNYVADFKHVQVIPSTRLTSSDDPNHLVDDVHHRAMVAATVGISILSQVVILMGSSPCERTGDSLLFRTRTPNVRSIERIANVSCGTPCQTHAYKHEFSSQRSTHGYSQEFAIK